MRSGECGSSAGASRETAFGQRRLELSPRRTPIVRASRVSPRGLVRRSRVCLPPAASFLGALSKLAHIQSACFRSSTVRVETPVR